MKNLWNYMSGRRFKKGKMKAKHVSKLNGLGIDLDFLIAMTNEYLRDLVTEQKSLEMIGATMKFQRFINSDKI